ncbi:NADPH-dependent FMN reductase [Bacillus lacus]|uniref:NADPH-dependent FMN reductase n=1 Tax=Metabacillus lacus TaxID=1983721 RepID=A0A7X2J0H1_9BACI|nr:NADPH-dependent FMN reductase [Metabacillus lacus]MRX73076.1 NADPH-dependent FMN reductase [Metabacillus lacus]
MTDILLISGSPSAFSRSDIVLSYIGMLLEESGRSFDIVSVRDFPAEVLAQGLFQHQSISEFSKKVAEAEKIVIASPVYKASYTGVLKALLDLLPQEAFLDKPLLPVAVGGTVFHLLSIEYSFKPLFSSLGCTSILKGVYAVDSQIHKVDGITDSALAERISGEVNKLLSV